MPAFVLALALFAPVAVAAQAPDEEWRTLTTTHFRVTFPLELEGLAREAAERAEWAYEVLEPAFIRAPDGPIDLVVTDHVDVSNGFAEVTPSNRMTVFARPPLDVLSLGYFEDWLELVVLHELAHVVHLDYANNPVGRIARSIFGRVSLEWPFFPGLATPRWVTEGLATWYESHLTEAGRVHGTYQEMQLRTALLEGRFERLDQASGNSPLWPGGNRPYTYGARFFEFLLERHGEERMAAFAEAVAGQWIPYRMNAAATDAFGVSFSDEWDAWRASLEAELEDLDRRLEAFGAITSEDRLTHDARWGLHPSVSPDGSTLVYVRSDGRSDLQLRADAPGGGAARQLTRTNGLATYDWLPDGSLLVSQVEAAGPFRQYRDLYTVSADGSERRLTNGARLTNPTASSDGSWAIAVQQGGGTNGLVRVDLGSGSVTPWVAPDPDVHWAFPSLSPDDRWVAATRWETGGLMEVVLLDASSGVVEHRLGSDRAIDLAPAWSDDGSWLVWGSDRTGIPNVLGARIDPASGAPGTVRLMTNVRTGAVFPSLDPSGAWLYYTAYHVDGWDVARTPFLADDAPAAPPVDARFAAAQTRERGFAGGEVGPYVPGLSLAPTYWEISYREPLAFPGRTTSDGFVLRPREGLGYALGIQTAGRDLVGRHSYSLYGRMFTEAPKPEAAFGYTYTPGNPSFNVTLGQNYVSGGQLAAGTTPDTLFIVERERFLSGAMTFVAPTMRRTLSATLAGGFVWESRELRNHNMLRTNQYNLSRPDGTLTDVSLSLLLSTSRTHSFQMGRARGMSVFVQGRIRNELGLPDSLVSVIGADRTFAETRGRLRAALPLWETGRVTHVLAVQAAGGAASGPGATAGHYFVGGASGTPEGVTGGELFGGNAIFFPLRGYPQGARFGRFAWAATAEYRFPIAIVNRGLGAWPVHLDRLAGSLFVDVGNAWGPVGTNPTRSMLGSVGAELTTEFFARFDTRLRLRTGVAVPLREGSTRVYLRAGLPF